MIVVHVAAEPALFEDTTRIIQPCARCGLILSEFDQANPPSVLGPPTDWSWWAVGEQVEIDGEEGGARMFSIVDDAEILERNLQLCEGEPLILRETP